MRVLVNIDVDDLEKAIRFYTAAFGLTLGRRFGDDAVELLGGSAAIYLLAKAEGMSAALISAAGTPASNQSASMPSVSVTSASNESASTASGSTNSASAPSRSTPSQTPKRLRRCYDRHWTPVHLDFVVDDIERSVKSAITAGAQLEQPIKTEAWGRLALMSDPFGHGFCYIQFLGRGYDELVSP